jgi:hypothetical protein
MRLHWLTDTGVASSVAEQPETWASIDSMAQGWTQARVCEAAPAPVPVVITPHVHRLVGVKPVRWFTST